MRMLSNEKSMKCEENEQTQTDRQVNKVIVTNDEGGGDE